MNIIFSHNFSVNVCTTRHERISLPATYRVVLSQTFKTLTKFIEKNTKIYSTKLIPLN